MENTPHLNNEISLVQIYRPLKANFIYIVIFSIICSGLAYFATSFATKHYKATAIIYPLGGGGGAGGGGIANLLASMGGGGGGGGDLGVTNRPSIALLKTLLKSRSFSNKVAQTLNLHKIFYPNADPSISKEELLRSAGNKFRTMLFLMNSPKSGVLEISVHNTDPKLATKLVNLTLIVLDKYIKESVFTETKRHKQFIASQVKKNKVNILELGKKLAAYHDNFSVTASNSTIDLIMDDGELITDTDQTIIDEFKSDEEPAKKVALSVKDVPQSVYLEYLIGQKSVYVNLAAVLSSQYEMAKIDEEKRDLSFQIIDYGVEPGGPFKPRRSLIAMAIFIVGVFISSTFFILRSYEPKTA